MKIRGQHSGNQEAGHERPNVSASLSRPVLPEQVVDGGSAPVHAPQHVSGASLQVPAQRQAVQVRKQTHLKCGRRVTERSFTREDKSASGCFQADF